MTIQSRVDQRPVGSLRVVLDPHEKEWAELASNSALPDEFVRHSLDPDERTRFHCTESAMLLVLRVPTTNSASGLPFATAPLGLILANGNLYAVSAVESSVLSDLRQLSAEVASWPRHRLILHALRLTADAYLHDLAAINAAVDGLEDRLREALENRAVLEILKYQKSLVYFTTALHSLEQLVERLQKTPEFHLPEAALQTSEEVLIEIRQALEVATVSRDILSEMMDAFASIISNNLNVVMKFMAAVTVILTLPVTVASFWGMNVPLPLAASTPETAVSTQNAPGWPASGSGTFIPQKLATVTGRVR
ncbi:MAG TPA: magnesium transporter CorA family protein, partial [Polyangiaceae bacterium]|nr:magnesium transporter CorA family protein [Polyangiaceae bacterium]